MVSELITICVTSIDRSARSDLYEELPEDSESVAVCMIECRLADWEFTFTRSYLEGDDGSIIAHMIECHWPAMSYLWKKLPRWR